MAKKRGLASDRGLDALLGSIKKEKLIAGNLPTLPVTQSDSHDSQNTVSFSTNSHSHNGHSTAINNQAEIQLLSLSNSHPANSKNTKKPAVQLLGDTPLTPTTPEINLLHINVSQLQRGKYQPRIDLGEEALQELASSIAQHGVMQPIVIRPLLKKNQAEHASVTHEIIAGERRWRAAQIAGLSHIPAIERPISDDLAIALALIENIQREDLSVMEQAVALQRFHDEFGMSHAQIADVVGKARTTVSNLLRLNGLHADVKSALNAKQMDMGHARALLSLSVQQQPIIAKRIIQEQLTVRQTEQLIKDILHPQAAPTPKKELDYDRLRLNQLLSERFGAVVKVKGTAVGKGSIEIFYHNPDELQALIEQLQTPV